MKKLITFLMTLMLLTVTAGAIDIYVDTNPVETDTEPVVIDGRTMVPLRAIFEALGATVEWEPSSRTATGVRDDVTVSIQIDSKTAYINGIPQTLDVPAQLINNRTMVPARFVSEALGCEVTWNQPTQTVGIADELRGQSIYVTPTGKRYHFNGTCNGGTYYEATLAEAMGRGLTPCDKCVLTIGDSGASGNPTDEITTPPTAPAEPGVSEFPTEPTEPDDIDLSEIPDWLLTPDDGEPDYSTGFTPGDIPEWLLTPPEDSFDYDTDVPSADIPDWLLDDTSGTNLNPSQWWGNT